MGPSGSGKSTLMHLLAGLDTPTAGSVRVAGRELAGMNDDELTLLRRDQIGFVFQAFNLLPMLSVEENVLLPSRIAGVKPDAELAERVIAGSAWPSAAATCRPSCRAASSSGWRSPARSSAGRRSVRRRAHRQPRLRDRRRDPRRAARRGGPPRPDHRHGHPRRHAAAVADRVVVLADGRIVEDRVSPMSPSQNALAQRKLRTALTVLAIVVGVGMVSAGALVLGDSMKKGADSLSASSYRGTDAVVSAKTPFTVSSQTAGATPTIPGERAPARAVGAPGGRRRWRHHRPAGQAGRQGRQAGRRRPLLRRGLRRGRRRWSVA